MNTLVEQGKVKGDANNFDYIIRDYSGDDLEVPSMVVFITEEQFNYFQKSIIKTSAKDLIISSLIIDNLEQIFEGFDMSEENAVKNQLAIGKEDFKFIVPFRNRTVLDDIDAAYFMTGPRNLFIAFDGNETRKIFAVVTSPVNSNDSSNKFYYLEFIPSDYNGEDFETKIINIDLNNKNYKYIKVSDPK